MRWESCRRCQLATTRTTCAVCSVGTYIHAGGGSALQHEPAAKVMTLPPSRGCPSRRLRGAGWGLPMGRWLHWCCGCTSQRVYLGYAGGAGAFPGGHSTGDMLAQNGVAMGEALAGAARSAELSWYWGFPVGAAHIINRRWAYRPTGGGKRVDTKTKSDKEQTNGACKARVLL